MSQRDRQRPRPVFHGTSWEPLEDRQLLSGASATSAIASNVAASQTRWSAIFASHPSYAAHYAQISQRLGELPAGQIHSAGGSTGRIAIPENGPMFQRRMALARPGWGATGNTPTALSYQNPPVMGGSPASASPTFVSVTGSSGASASGARAGLGAPMPAGAVGAMPMMPAPAPAAPPNPLAGLDKVTLSLDDVNGLKTSVETFATNYTSGQDKAKDSSAVAALQTGLNDLAQSVWAETHVASKESVAALQQAVNTFATQYSSGMSATQDKTAWVALKAAVATFGTGLKNPSAPAVIPVVANAPASNSASARPHGGPMMMPPGGPMMMKMGMMGRPEMGGLADSLLRGPALTTDEVATLKTAVETFASTYTYGVNKTTDQAATDALGTALGGLSQKHWEATAAQNVASPGSVPGPGSATAASGTPSAEALPRLAWKTYVSAPSTTKPSGTA